MFRLLVAGGRNFYDYEFIDTTLTNWYDEISWLETSGLIVVHGDAAGVDRIAAQWAKYNSFPTEAHEAKWKELGKAAGAIRNQEMLEAGIDYAILFPGGFGTANMKHLLVKAKVPFREVQEVLDSDNKEMYTR